MTTTTSVVGDLDMPLPRAWRLLWAQTIYQARITLRTPRAIVAGAAIPGILLVMSNEQHHAVPANHLAGYAVLGLTIIAWTSHGASLVGARESGVLKRWRATPLPRWCYFVARIAATVVIAIAAGVIVVVLGVALYGTSVDADRGIRLAIALSVGSIAWAAPATAVTGLIPNVDAASPILTVTYLPIILASGIFGVLDNQPHWLMTVASYLPAQPIIDAATRALGDTEGSLLPAHDAIVLVGWAVAGLVASIVLFRWEPVGQTDRKRTSRSALADASPPTG